jgi:hypothetical protein
MSPRKRRLLLLSMLAAAVAFAVGVWLCWPRTAINRDNFEKIHAGMARAEVEAILGGPPRVEAAEMLEMGPWEKRGPKFLAGAGVVHFGEAMDGYWVSDRFIVWVDFDPNGRVTDKVCIPVRPMRVGPLEWLRRSLGL